MKRRLLLVFAVLVAAWLVACAFLFVWPRTDPPGRADAVVVLSGGRDSRLDPALALARQGVAPLLVISSPAEDGNWRTAQRLCKAGSQTAAFRVLCFEAVPFNTQGEARAIARLAREHGWRRVVVVTSTYHVTRARMLIRRCYHGGLALVGAGAPWWRLPEEWASETGKLLVQLTLRRGC